MPFNMMECPKCGYVCIAGPSCKSCGALIFGTPAKIVRTDETLTAQAQPAAASMATPSAEATPAPAPAESIEAVDPFGSEATVPQNDPIFDDEPSMPSTTSMDSDPVEQAEVTEFPTSSEPGEVRTLIFHGSGGSLFGIHMINTLLTLITFGIYMS